MSGLDAEALDFSELFPFLKLEDSADLDTGCLDELPDEQMMELLRVLGNELEEQVDDKEQAQESKTEGAAGSHSAGTVDVGDQTEETSAVDDKPMSTRVRTYTARKVRYLVISTDS